MFLAVLWSALTSAVVWALPRILLAIGFYAVSDTISSTIFGFLKDKVLQQFNGLGAEFINILYLSGIYDAVIITFSAYALAIGIKAVRAASGSIPDAGGL